jgi:hypothetical protein
MSDQLIKRVVDIVEQIGPLLSGQGPGVQGAVLADLTAMWLASHIVPGDEPASLNARRQIFQVHVEHIWELVRVNEIEVLRRLREEREPNERQGREV